MENIGMMVDGRVLTIAGTCGCGNYVSEMDDTLAYAISGWVYCNWCV